jgi:vitamin B12 transporter
VPQTLKLGATFFRTTYKDLIVFQFVPPSAFLPMNVNTAKAKGVEVSGEWTTGPAATIQANYTYTGTRDDSTSDQLVRRPRNKANLALIFHPDPEADLRIDYRYVGERLDFGGETIPSYSVVAVAAAQQWTPAVKLFARIENFFDREYEEVTGFGTAGRSFYGGLTTTF